MNQLALINHQKAAFDAQYYTLNQLKSFYSKASFGFLCAMVASWLLISFYLAGFFAGSELEYMGEWRGIQFVFAGMGVAVATALAVAEGVLFGSGKTREYVFVAVFSVAFGVFAETASTMQREQQAVRFKSEHSAVFQTTLKAANQLTKNVGLSPSQGQLANAQALLAQTDDANERALLKSRIAQLQHRVELELQNNSNLLATTLAKAKELEYDESNHQAMIRFLSESLGFQHITASAFLAFFMITTFKLCTHYLGVVKQRSERAIAINQGEIVFSAEVINERPTLPHAPSVPIHGLTHGQNRAAIDITRTHTDNHTDNQTVRDTDKHEPKPNTDINAMQERYTEVFYKKAGDSVECPTCQTVFKKKTYNQCFCKPACKDSYWNLIKPERLIEARAGEGIRP